MLTALVEHVAEGESILIGLQGSAIAKLARIEHGKKKIFGAMKGELVVRDDFDAPLPEEILDAFEGRELT